MLNLTGLFGKEQIFIPTGWPSLDANLNGGLLAKTVTAVFSEPGTGASALAMNFCLNAAAMGHRCLLLTHDGEVLGMAKMLAALAEDIDVSIGEALHQIETGVVSEKMRTAAESLVELDVVIKEAPVGILVRKVIEEFADADNSKCGKPLVIVYDGMDDCDCNPFSVYTCLKDCANSYNAVVVATAHKCWNGELESPSTYHRGGVMMAMDACDAVLAFTQDISEPDLLGLSIHKCRYAHPCDAVTMVLLHKSARVYEVGTAEE